MTLSEGASLEGWWTRLEENVFVDTYRASGNKRTCQRRYTVQSIHSPLQPVHDILAVRNANEPSRQPILSRLLQVFGAVGVTEEPRKICGVKRVKVLRM